MVLIEGTVHQRHLSRVIHELFPVEHIINNSRKEATLVNPATSNLLELDVWIPNLKLCFEFQDEYHYNTTWYYHDSLQSVLQRDSTKTEILRNKGETLVTVPFWWDSTAASLAAAIRFQRPELLFHFNESFPISLNPHRTIALKRIPGIGELMAASYPPANTELRDILKKDNWWLGEKYDGMRFYWHHSRSILYSRTGARILLPLQVIISLPSLNFEGEIWFGRGEFAQAQKIALVSAMNTLNLPNLRFIVFDQPVYKLAFEQRYKKLVRGTPATHPTVVLAFRVFCKSVRYVSDILQNIIDDEGEGVILRKEKSFYESGRSHSLLKLKASRGDREGLVIDITADSYILKQPDDQIIVIPKVESVVPKLGDVMTFSYESLAPKTELPVNPVFERIRYDITWEDILQIYETENSQKQDLNTHSNTILQSNLPDMRTTKNLREFFVKFANDRNCDPLLPSTWYSASRTLISETKGADAIFKHYNGGIVHALLHLFPEIGLQQENFDVLPAKHWANVKNRREFFVKYAKSHGFDPRIPTNWYTVPKESILNTKHASSVLSYYNTSVESALLHLFPDIGLDSESFFPRKRHHWSDVNNRRQFFVNLMKEKGLDPSLASSWNSLTQSMVVNAKGGSSILPYYNGKVKEAIAHLFQ